MDSLPKNNKSTKERMKNTIQKLLEAQRLIQEASAEAHKNNLFPEAVSSMGLAESNLSYSLERLEFSNPAKFENAIQELKNSQSKKIDEQRKTAKGYFVRKMFEASDSPRPFSICLYDPNEKWVGLGNGDSFDIALDDLIERQVEEIKGLRNILERRDGILRNFHEVIEEALGIQQDEQAEE
jgi:hypothetical protein